MSEDAQKQDDISADDWAAALAEQETSAPAAGGGDDDWAAALAEQEVADKAMAATGDAPAPQKAQIFPNLTPDAAQPAANNLDLILDIPVQLNVELGRTKIAIRNLLQLAQGSVVELDGSGRSAHGCAGERLPDRPGRGGGGQRQVRHSPDRYHQSRRAPAPAQSMKFSGRFGVAGRAGLAFFLFIVVMPAWSAAEPPAVSTGGALFQGLLGLVIVLAALVAFFWFLRRFSPGQSGAQGAVKVVGGVMLGPRESAGRRRGGGHLASARRGGRTGQYAAHLAASGQLCAFPP
jgi:flagellar motor switch protein FliN/FliY